MKPLTTSFCRPQHLSPDKVGQLFELYATYYGGTSASLFEHDLRQKDWILLLHGEHRQICGFSTLKILTTEHQNQHVRAIFSGDTIIAHEYWGSQTLPLAWCELIGRIAAEQPETPLYWLLIVKGDRTYRYLNVFSKQYFPNRKIPTPPDVQILIHQLARSLFGEHYLPEQGIVHYPQSRGHLKPEWHNPSTSHNPEARFFAECNPHFADGDELVCLTLLREDNLKSFALRGFQAGIAQGSLKDES